MEFIEEKLKAIQEKGKEYTQCLRKLNTDTLLKDDLSDLMFFFSHTFLRGRADSASNNYLDRVYRVFKNHVHPGILLGFNATKENQLRILLEENQAGNKYDIEHVIDALRFRSRYTNVTGYNITRYSVEKIMQGRVRELYIELDDIKGVGDKLASFYLRDLVETFNLNVNQDQYKYLVPVDTHVVRVAECLHLVRIDQSDKEHELKEKVKNAIISISLRYGISPLLLDHGMWILGFKNKNKVNKCNFSFNVNLDCKDALWVFTKCSELKLC